MMLGPAERLVKHSATAGLRRRARGLGVRGFDVRATRIWRLAPRTRTGCASSVYVNLHSGVPKTWTGSLEPAMAELRLPMCGRTPL
jgi:hypothetical protein